MQLAGAHIAALAAGFDVSMKFLELIARKFTDRRE
jgi:hypothetical protein